MSKDSETPSNVFVRFKQHVDSNIASGLNTVFPHQGPRRYISETESPSISSLERTSHKSAQSKPNMSSPNEDKESGLNAIDVLSISSSSYNPQSLRNLPQPVPKDLPSHLDPSVFTFQDAFEDLLEVSQGKPLPTITARHEQSKLLRQMFPSGEPTWFWLRRLESQGLMPPARTTRPIFSMQPDWEQFHRELRQKTDQVWRAVRDEMDGLATREFFPENNNAASSDKPVNAKGQEKRDGPDNFDEFYDSLKSTFSEGQRTWDTFRKLVTDNSGADANTAENAPTGKKVRTRQSAPITAGGGDENRNNQTETREEYVDRWGYLHSKVKRTTVDSDGNEIGTETHLNIRPATEEEKSRTELNNGLDQGDGNGWFWK